MKINKIGVAVSILAGFMLVVIHQKLISGSIGNILGSLSIVIMSIILGLIYSFVVYIGFFSKNYEMVQCILIGFVVSAALNRNLFRIDFLPPLTLLSASLVYIRFISRPTFTNGN